MRVGGQVLILERSCERIRLPSCLVGSLAYSQSPARCANVKGQDHIKGDERILRDSDFVDSVLLGSPGSGDVTHRSGLAFRNPCSRHRVFA